MLSCEARLLDEVEGDASGHHPAADVGPAVRPSRCGYGWRHVSLALTLELVCTGSVRSAACPLLLLCTPCAVDAM